MALKFERWEIGGFDYTAGDLTAHATLYVYLSPYDNNRLYKYVDEEHGFTGGGYFNQREAMKMFKRRLREIAA